MDTATIADREIMAFVAGAEERTTEIRGYGLTEAERAEVEAEAAALYAESETAAA